MTLSSAYIELFIRGEKSGGKCPGGNVRIPGMGMLLEYNDQMFNCQESRRSNYTKSKGDAALRL